MLSNITLKSNIKLKRKGWTTFWLLEINTPLHMTHKPVIALMHMHTIGSLLLRMYSLLVILLLLLLLG